MTSRKLIYAVDIVLEAQAKNLTTVKDILKPRPTQPTIIFHQMTSHS